MPEFGEMQVLQPHATTEADVHRAKILISIRHLLSHSAGLSYGFVEPDSVIDQCYLNDGINGLGEKDIDLEGALRPHCKTSSGFRTGDELAIFFRNRCLCSFGRGALGSIF